MRDRAVIAVGFQPVENRREHLIDLPRAGAADVLPLRVPLEVDDALVQPPEPVPQPGGAQVRHTKDRAQAQYRQRLQIVRHQLGPVPPAQPVEKTGGDRAHQVIDVGAYVPGPVLGVKRVPQFVVELTVDGDDGRRAERAVNRRIIKLGREQFRVGADELHVVIAGDKPQANGRDETHRRLPPQARIDRIRIVLEFFHGHRFGECGDRPAGHGADRMDANEPPSRHPARQARASAMRSAAHRPR